ncbi:MAG: 3-oxoacyl-[acyl-carrier-protein] synthase III C-terminal domain-containing protein [Candidatus Absconditabacterales bacterium]|jgi:3-oxoacyl-[acyl-carrier-protein] synthase-3
MKKIYSKIIGTGSHDFSSDRIVHNSYFLSKDFIFYKEEFYDAEKKKISKTRKDIVQRFEEITGTKQRHYAADGKLTSTLAIEAGENAIISSKIDREELDCIIVANNFGDVMTKADKIDLVPCYAARIKNHLGIINPSVVAYDIEYGGPSDERAFRMFQDALGLGDKDLVIHINDHEQDDIMEVAEYLLPNCSVDKESLNSIVVVHCLGQKPSLAHKVKVGLGIKNPNTMTLDIFFGCTGFLQAMIQVDTMIKCGKIKKALIIGAEILSRVAEEVDVDKMLYGDGGGAVVISAIESEEPVGLLYHKVRSDTFNQQAFMIQMGKSYDPNHNDPNELFLKMQGRRVHKHALSLIPLIIKESLREAGLRIEDIAKMVFHQPNPLMLEEIALRTFAQFDLPVPDGIMPIIGDTYGNSSVACIPLILDRMYRNRLGDHKISSGDIIMLLAIGGGMHINIAYYKIP